ncbi:MAG: S9 family peptidase [Candidatus Zixiibacteriota bacterium]
MRVFRSTAQLAVMLALTTGAIAQTATIEQRVLRKQKYIPDIATFLQIGGSSAAGLSWDGKQVFFTSSMSGANQVYRLTEAGWPYQLSMFEDGIDFFTLSYGSDMAIVGASVGGSEQSQLFLMDTQTGQVTRLTNLPKVQFGSVTWAKDDRSIYYRSNEENLKDFFIYRMSLADGQSVKVFGDTAGVRGSNSIADISQDGNKLIVSNYRSTVDNDLYLVDLKTGGHQKLTSDTLDVMYSSPTLMPDNTTIWVLCNDNPDGISRLAKMRVGSPEVEFVTDGWVDPKWEVEGLGFSRDYKYQAVSINEDGYMRLKIREVESRTELPSPPLAGMLGGPLFDQSGACIVSFNGPTHAPDVWRWNPATKELKQLTFAPYAGIDRELFGEPALVHYRSFDSLEIPALLYLPKNYQKGTPIPFLVDAHGGPEGQSRPYFTRNIQYLILNGFGIIQPNVRGSEGYGREYINLDNYKNRKNSLKDYKVAVDYLIANGYSKAGQIGIRGGSYGGYVVLGMITEYPDLFAAAVDEVGIANFVTFLQNTAAYRRALREAEYGPLSDSAFLREISPIWKADRIKTPLLVVHGANDPRVPISEARQIIKAIQDNGGVVDSLIFADEGHGSSKRVNIIAEYRKQVEFFGKHLRKDESAQTGQ